NGLGSGAVNLGSGTLTLIQGSFTGVISGTGSLVQDNPGGGTSAAVVLTGVQTFTGGVQVNHGSVTFANQAPQHVGAALNGGTWGVYNGSSLLFSAGSNITSNLANVTISGSSSAFAKFSTVTNNGGSFTITGGKTFVTAGAMT